MFDAIDDEKDISYTTDSTTVVAVGTDGRLAARRYSGGRRYAEGLRPK